ncbi:hypothetical protein EV379_1221 [Microterricola gilva]|uniref:Uncharacterized protein n=1 Tax=Microterricola gilva TaxID=393267 RepID=A0A4Q8AK82_9MICO|nr:hypothetical protein [Microterricola gilva]RZU64910.1 hypothetical protein EV379_1221 [Microterricola gilva]
MARIRSIKPEFWRSPSTAKASPRARLLYIAMWNWCDDHGVGEWTPRELLGFAFPNDDDVTNAEFQSLCTEVATCFGTEFYTINGRRFYCIPAWDEHQKNERRANGKYPRPDAPDACVDAEVHRNAEARGTSVRTHGKTPAGTEEQGTEEQRNREQRNPRSAVAITHDLDALFSAAYDHWPKKADRKDALAKFKKAAGSIPVDDLVNVIIRFGDAYEATTERQFVPALGVWIGRERWTDDLPTRADASRKPTRTEQNLDFVAQLAAEEAMSQRGIEA